MSALLQTLFHISSFREVHPEHASHLLRPAVCAVVGLRSGGSSSCCMHFFILDCLQSHSLHVPGVAKHRMEAELHMRPSCVCC